MGNKGLHTFTGDEGSNLLAGQCAAYYFNPYDGDQKEIEAGVGDFVDVDFFFALKAKFTTTDTDVSARSLIGDDLSLTGTYVDGGGQEVTMIKGDIIYGCFDKIYSDGNGLLLYMKLK